MINEGIKGVDFVICNTDAQALEMGQATTKIQLGMSLTEGLGAGENPSVGEQAALESENEIKAILKKKTKMVFITAGMGGGTGTGAAVIKTILVFFFKIALISFSLSRAACSPTEGFSPAPKPSVNDMPNCIFVVACPISKA
jgi:hypothetical protein